MHVGRRIHQVLREQGRSVTWFANKLCCTRSNAYKIFERESVDTCLLSRISLLLEYDFFSELSEGLQETGRK